MSSRPFCRYAAFAGTLCLASVAHAETEPSRSTELSTPAVQECVANHDRAALLRKSDRFEEARQLMTRCADESCPIALRSDCSAWLEELAQAEPSLLVVVERDEDSTLPVRLELDGEVYELSEQTRSIATAPGSHHLRFSLEGHAPIALDVTLARGEKNRLVRVRFDRAPAAAPPPPAAAPPAVAPGAPVRSRPVPPITYALAGGSLLAFGGATALLASALSSYENAENECAPSCPDAEGNSIRTRLLLADLAGVAGFVLGGLAVYTYVKRPWATGTAPAAQVGVSVAPGRASVGVVGRF